MCLAPAQPRVPPGLGGGAEPRPAQTRQAREAQPRCRPEPGSHAYRESPDVDEVPPSRHLVTCQLPARRQVPRTLCFRSSGGGRRPEHAPAIRGHRPVCSWLGGLCVRVVCRHHPGPHGVAPLCDSQARTRGRVPTAGRRVLSELPAVCPQTGHKRGPGGAYRAFLPMGTFSGRFRIFCESSVLVFAHFTVGFFTPLS